MYKYKSRELYMSTKVGLNLEYEGHWECIVYGDLEGLKEVIEKTSLSCNERLFELSIVTGNLHIVKYLYESGCPMPDSCIYLAMKHRRENILDYFIEEGFQWDQASIEYACTLCSVEILRKMWSIKDLTFTDNMFYYIARTGDLECIRFLVEKGHHFADYHFAALCQSGNLGSLELVHREGSYNTDDLNYLFNEVEILEIFKYLHEEMGLSISEYALDDQIIMGNVDIVEYMISIGYKPDEGSAFQALDSGRLDIVKLLHSMDVPFPSDEDVFAESEDDIGRYYHDHFYDKERCARECKRCIDLKVETLWNTWYMDDLEYVAYNQWLPREMLEDIDWILHI